MKPPLNKNSQNTLQYNSTDKAKDITSIPAPKERDINETEPISDNYIFLSSNGASPLMKKVKVKKANEKVETESKLIEKLIVAFANERNETKTKNINVTLSTVLKLFFQNLIQTAFIFLKTSRKQNIIYVQDNLGYALE